jgi:class 3 adenylate cyclase/tetratricopeptide (TPR) repeat protein
LQRSRLPLGASGSDDPHVHRKVVTVLFCDVVGSTALGETVDPEALQGLLARYFERMKATVESHGGSVEKFIGDAVVAVFGVPQLHEDDALRACRAAVEMRDAFPELGVQGRIGVNTGEVVTGTEERLATGDAVNVAARLQNAADPGEILIGEATFDLVRAAVEAEAIQPLELKGKAKPVPAHRLVSVLETPERSHESPFVGRERELELIREAWAHVHDEQRCEVVTIVGEGGVGKSRLVAEALRSVDARTVYGRCPPYGEGIAYWPVVEVVKQLDSLPNDPDAATALRSLLRETDRDAWPDEIVWAFRKLLEEHAPLVVVFDDIQWGEETFLDLVEGVALLSSGASILLVCMARDELVSKRKEWPIALRLEPLPQQAVEELIGDSAESLRERIVAAAGGNPLFVTQMLAMAEVDADVDVPPTLRALLAARLDQLDGAERYVLERGAIEGEIFHRGAVQALAPGERQITPRLAALVRRQLIRPDQAQLPGDDGFRFRHLLIRDAAYDALPKSVRAELHEQFANWLEQRSADLVELDEILGYHLEQAARYKAELGQPDTAVAVRAGDRLAAAGLRAFKPGSELPARPLFTRALELTRPVRLDVGLEVNLAATYHMHDPEQAAAICDEAANRARLEGNDCAEAHARTVAALHRLYVQPEPDVDELERLALGALHLLEEVGDHAGLAQVWVALGAGVAGSRGRMEDWAYAAERSISHARAAGWRTPDDFGLWTALTMGPRPADEVLRTLDEWFPEATEPRELLKKGQLVAMLGRLDEARALADRAHERLLELGAERFEVLFAEIATLTGDYDAAARYWQKAVDDFEEHGHALYQAGYGARLGRCLCALGRYDEAEPWAQLGRNAGLSETEWIWGQVQALVHAYRGEHEAAEREAREAVDRAERTDQLSFQGDALADLAEVLVAAGRTEEAAEAYEQALDRYGRKKNLAMIAQVQPRLDTLRAGTRR